VFGDRDLGTLVDLAGVWSMPNGWQVVIRADWVDATPGRPHGLSYALILQDDQQQRILGFDNSHAYDSSPEGEPFDHEHRPDAIGRTFRYRFASVGQLITDFFGRCEAHCAAQGVKFEFELNEDV
jgi:hypothetical protein